MPATVRDTGTTVTLPVGRIVPVQFAFCPDCGWRGSDLKWSLFSWTAQDAADDHNTREHMA